jgi:hypothetical protein
MSADYPEIIKTYRALTTIPELSNRYIDSLKDEKNIVYYLYSGNVNCHGIYRMNLLRKYFLRKYNKNSIINLRIVFDEYKDKKRLLQNTPIRNC